ncbi:MAG: hypothetical protein ABR522_10870 [Marinobacter sp.]
MLLFEYCLPVLICQCCLACVNAGKHLIRQSRYQYMALRRGFMGLETWLAWADQVQDML